jgi:hypothetical protein
MRDACVPALKLLARSSYHFRYILMVATPRTGSVLLSHVPIRLPLELTEAKREFILFAFLALLRFSQLILTIITWSLCTLAQDA